jgi:hypothetical protein
MEGKRYGKFISQNNMLGRVVQQETNLSHPNSSLHSATTNENSKNTKNMTLEIP